MKKVILITGVAGMVGSNLVKEYIKKNNIIIGIDNFTLGEKKFIQPYLNNKKFHFFKKDLSKKISSSKINELLKKNFLNEIWLLAANSDIQKGTKNYQFDLNNTFLSTINSLDLIKNYINKNSKIIFTSSSAIYGNTNKRISEDTIIQKPISNYGAMKLSCEAYLSSFANANSAQISIFRFPNVVGKNLTHGLLFDMKKKILSKKKIIQVLGNGEQQKPYSYVNEIIKCMIFIKNKKFKKRINYFNIGSNDKGIKVKKIINMMVKKFNSKKKVIYQKDNIGWVGDVSKYQYSTKKINKIGFNFRYSSKKSIELCIKELL